MVKLFNDLKIHIMRIKIKKTVLGEVYLIYVRLSPKKYECILWLCASNKEYKAKISEDFNHVILCETFILKGYGEAIGGLSGYGKAESKEIKKIKLHKYDALRAKECILGI